MRSPGVLVLALLLAGTRGSDIEPTIREKGGFVEITVTTFPNTVSKCYLVTPSKVEIELLADNTLIYSDKYEYLNNLLSSCRVRINNLDKDDEGLWSLNAVLTSNDDPLSQQINLSIIGADSSEEHSDETVDLIEPTVREKGDFVVMTVPTFPNTVSKCYLVTPSKVELDLLADDTLTHGFKYEYLPNSLSSCRVRINNLDKGDEGLWSLNAVLTSNDDPLSQQINLSIIGADSSEEHSDETVDLIEPTVREKGDFVEIIITTIPNTVSKCYLVTPSKVELDLLADDTLTHGDKYEYLPNSLSSCRVRINNLDKRDEGLWSLNAVLTSNDDRLSQQINLSIIGADSSEEHSDETVDLIEPTVREKGDFVEIIVTTIPNTVSKCYLVTPSKVELDLLADDTLTHGDKYEYLPNSLSSCRVRINNLDKRDEGLWSLNAVLTSNDDRLSQQINLSIIGADSLEEHSDETVDLIEPTVREKGDFVEIIVTTIPNTVSKCYLVTPSKVELDLLADDTLTHGDKYEYLPNSLSSCRVRINNLDKRDEGLWSLNAVLTSNDDPLSQQINLSIIGADSSEEHSDETVDLIEPTVREKGDFVEIIITTIPNTVSKCYLVTPSKVELDLLADDTLTHGDKYEYLPNSLSSCRVRINNLDKGDEGLWSLNAVLTSNDDPLSQQINLSIIGADSSEEHSDETADLIEPTVREKGDFVVMTVPTFPNTVSKCYLVTPSKVELDLLADDTLTHGDKYEYLPNSLSSCRVRINNLDKGDEGLWSLNDVLTSNDDPLSQQINLSIIGADSSEEHSDETADLIEPTVREKGDFVEIIVTTIPNTVSKCYLVTPSKVELDLLADDTLTHGDKYEYLPNSLSSCRVRINNLDKGDEGLWSLNAVLTSNDDPLSQQINLSIIGADSSEEHSDETADLIEPTVREKGDFVVMTVPTFPNTVSKCYLVTPSKVELDLLADDTLTHGDKYEYRPNSLSSCRVRINNLTKDDEGLWSLYADLSSSDDVLYQQVNLAINRAGSSDEENKSENSEETTNSVTGSSKNSEETADSEVLSSENSQVSVEDVAKSEENENVSSAEDPETISREAEPTGTRGAEIEPTIREKGGFLEITVTTISNTVSKCYLVTPSKVEIDLLADNTLIDSDKYEHLTNSLSSCRVRINNLDKGDEGLWSLNAVLTSNNDPLSQQINLLINGADSSEEHSDETADWIEPTVREKGGFVEMTVPTFSNTVSRCYLVTPSKFELDLLADDTLTHGDKYEYLSNSLSSCRVRINNLTKDDEGLWSLHAVLSSSDDVLYQQVNLAINRAGSSDEENKSENSEETTDSETVSSKSSEETVDSELISSQSSEETADSEALSSESSQVSVEDVAKSEETTDSETASSKSSEETVDSELISSKSSEETADSEALSSESSQVSVEDVAKSEENENVSSAEDPETVSREAESTEASSEEEQIIKEEWMSDLQFVTRTGLDVDINLPRTLNNKKCTLIKPDGTTVNVGDEVSGVTSHGSSDYVSCRVVVGPMEESLLGEWTLCGSYEEDGVTHRRCQRATIVWRNTANPDSMWQTTINPKFAHVVHFGGTLTPAVRGSGTVSYCHLVTPNGEDLIVTRDREYAHIRLVQDTDSLCSIAIGPIASSHLGDWTIYGTFNSVWGYNEVRLPISMELYDENHPYEQAYNVTTLEPTQHIVNLGSTIPVEITSRGAVDACQFTMPSGLTYFKSGVLPAGVAFVNDNRVACSLAIGPITEVMIGDWLLVGKFSNLDVYTENRLSFTIIREDPSNPIEEERTVQYLTEQFLDTDIGASHRIQIASDIFATFQSCHIRTPEGLQYTIMEGFDIPGVEVVKGSNIACGVAVVVSEDLIGTWTLIAREIRSSQPSERRLPFKIYVEETVEAVPNEITITAGNSIRVRLANPTDLNASCRLDDPSGEESPLASLDGTNQDTCGYIVSSVDKGHSGTWNIVYGNKIIYKAPVMVNVNVRDDPDSLILTWVEHVPVNQTIGPEEAVYCRVLSPKREVVFDHFGRCQVTLDRVLMDQHDGTWTMVVGLPGRIVTENHRFEVKVTAADEKPLVKSSVVSIEPTVELTCSVSSAKPNTGCLFRNPAGEVLVANQGVGEGRYAFHINQTVIEADHYYYSCGLQITNPVVYELGLWRCDLESEEDTYYGFITVLWPWAMPNPVVADPALTYPTLTAVAETVSVEQHQPATLACSARVPLRYCYFRAPNGTIFNVNPGTSSPSMQYVGAGFDAGECGVRFTSLVAGDTGDWSCHASINGEEQFHSIWVFVEEDFVVTSYLESGLLVINAEINVGRRVLEYCRFVRFDGLGFSSDNAPYPYMDESNLSYGFCRIRVQYSELDLRPWTVVAKIRGRDGEISDIVRLTQPQPGPVYYYNSLFMWVSIMMVMTVCLVVAAALAPAKNRRWAAERASSIRTSVRMSMTRFPSLRKKPALTDTNPAA